MNEQILNPEQSGVILADQNYAQNAPTMWNDTKLMQKSWKMAEVLSKTAIVPDNFKGKAGDCLIAIDLANRMGISPLAVMGYGQVVRGKFGWSGVACKAFVDGCGKFEESEYVMFGDPGSLGYGCYLQAVRKSDGKLIKGTPVTLQLAKDEGWTEKSGSKWKTMPELMLKYRAAAFFAKAEVPGLMMGFQSADEIRDLAGDDGAEKNTIKISLDSPPEV